MLVAIHNSHADLGNAFKAYIERRLRFALGRFGGRVGQITVHLCKKSPTDNSCRISTEIKPFGRLSVEEVDPDLFAAIDRATGRIGRIFARELERVQDATVGRESVRLTA